VSESGSRLTARPIRVLELRSVRGTGGGPEKTILLSAAQHDPATVVVTVCYIRDDRDKRFQIDGRALHLGIDYVEITERHSFDTRIWHPLKRLIRERGIHIIHAHEYKTDLLALLLAWGTGTVPMATVHGWSGDSWREHLYYYVDKKLLPRFPVVIAVSEPIRQSIIAHGADAARVRRIRNGIDPRVFTRMPGLRASARRAAGVPADAIVIGAVGRLESEKRFDLLLRGAAALRPEADPFVVIAGEGSQRNALQALARDLGMADRVKLLGHRNDALDVHHLFDIYAQTSSTEGIPNALLEAMAVGTPVVATNVGGTYELISHRVHGLLIPTGVVEALTAAIRLTLQNPAEAAARVAAARDRIEKELSFAARLASVEAIYAELAGQRV